MCITMAASIASQFPNMDKDEAVYAAFIKERIEKAGGVVKFQHLTGHLSHLDMSVRQTVGASPTDLRKFLSRHKGLFIVDSEGLVSLKSSEATTDKKNPKDRVVTNSNRNDSNSLFPAQILDAPGIVIKVLPTFGFISIKNPVKTSVYFTPACVIDDKFQIGNESGRLLTDIADMLPGKKVLLNAKKTNMGVEAKYRATKVWTPPNVKNEVLVPNGFHPKVPKDALYDPVSLEGSGKVQNVFEQFGFITNDSSNENIFFHKSKVCNVQNIMNLAKVFSPGDSVEFKAVRSKKQDIKVKWEASKVWIKKAGKSNLFKTEDSSGVGLSECDSVSQKSDNKQKGKVGKNIKPERQLLEAVAGKIYPHSDGVVIKFGNNDTELADADSCPFYLHGEKVQDVCWEFSDGDSVHFDGIKIKSAPGWKALLAWVGVKPNIVLPMHMGDFTEFSDDDSVSLKEGFVPDLKSKVVRPLEFSRQTKRHQRSKTPNNRSRTFVPSPASSQVSNQSSRSYPKSHTSVDKDFDLLSDDTMSSVSADSKPQASVSHKRRNRRSKYYSKPIDKASSRSSLTDDAALESEDNYSNQTTREFLNSRLRREDVGSGILSSANLKPAASCESLDFEPSIKLSTSSESLDMRKCLQPNPDLYKNWGDTPFPGEENNDTSPATKEITSQSNAIKSKENPKDSKLENESGPSPTLSPEPEIFHSDDEFKDAVETTEDINTEVKSQESEDFESENKLNLLKELSNSVDADKEVKSSPYVKYFRDLEGKITRVFCKYAEIEHGILKKSISALWSDLYHNGVPVADKFDDMKEIIKPGQTIRFNCIEIIDDAGSCWQKVTVAWRGQQPKVKEITPREYIEQNFLRVSVNKNEIDNCSQETSQDTGLNSTTESASIATAPPRKFLSVAAYSDDEEEESDVPSVKVEDTEEASVADVEIPIEDKQLVESVELDLTEAISQMILNFAESEVDIRTLSKNIISLVHKKTGESNGTEQPSTSAVSSEAFVNTKVDQACSTDNLSLPSEGKREMTNSETQTIITGDVIAQSLFTLSGQRLQ